MTAKELRKKYLKFFESKGHTIIPSASLVPENDPTTLFTTAGMHPLIPYLMGENHPGGSRVANVQKCVRTTDIDEVGDATHHTFFEMLGNWSFGDYFKKEAIEMSWEFLTSEEWLGLNKNRLAVSVFAGDEDAPFDEQSFEKWKLLGMPEKRIAKLPKKNNWWGPAGETGPCGSDTEIFYWAGDADKVPNSFNDDNELWVEIWNNVFMEYDKQKDGTYEKLVQQNVDTGMGLERILSAVNGFGDNYQSEIFLPIIEKIQELSGKKYDENEETKKSMRIIADHIKATVFIIADGIIPSNVQRGYVLRRLIRRAIRYGKTLGINENFTMQLAAVVIKVYADFYPELEKNKNRIFEESEKEENKFRQVLIKNELPKNRRIEILREIIGDNSYNDKNDEIIKHDFNVSGVSDLSMWKLQNKEDKFITASGLMSFALESTNGYPHDLFFDDLMDSIPEASNLISGIEKEFQKEFKKHQDLSRTASAGMFKGGLADAGEMTTKYHTATHLLLAAIREILGEEIYQKGSNITAERLRFDFNYPEKVSPEKLKQIEDLVNQKIQKNIPVEMMEMPKDEALKIAKVSFDPSKYGDIVKVYKIGDFSVELCGGPHVKNLSELGKFKITKEEASSAGVRRIKAVLE